MSSWPSLLVLFCGGTDNVLYNWQQKREHAFVGSDFAISEKHSSVNKNVRLRSRKEFTNYYVLLLE